MIPEPIQLVVDGRPTEDLSLSEAIDLVIELYVMDRHTVNVRVGPHHRPPTEREWDELVSLAVGAIADEPAECERSRSRIRPLFFRPRRPS